MGLISYLFGKRSTYEVGPHVSEATGKWLFAAPSGPSGKSVTPETALTLTSVYRAVTLLCGSVASLPLVTYRKQGQGAERATDHPIYKVLHSSPNKIMTSFEWRELVMRHLLLRGNSYNQIVRDNAGRLLMLMPMHPDHVKVAVDRETISLRYTYTPPGANPRTFTAGEVLHFKGMGDGITGESVISHAANSIGLAMAAEDHAALVFASGGSKRGLLKLPGKLTKESRDNLKLQWREQVEGVNNSHSVAVLESGMDWQEIGISAKDAQLLESRGWDTEQVARAFGVPPHKIGHLANATFSNIEHQGIEYVTDSLTPWIKRIEQAIERDLLGTEAATLEVRFLLDALLRGDTPSRYSAYATGRQWGWLSINDIRAQENLNPIEGGDAYLQPLNMISATDPAPKPADKPADLGLLRPKKEAKAAEIEGPEAPAEPEKVALEARKELETEPPEARISALKESFQVLFADLLGRAFRREAKALSSAAKKPAFVAACEDLYARQKDYLTEALLPAVELFAGLVQRAQLPAGTQVPMYQLPVELSPVVDRLISRSQSELLKVIQGEGELAERVNNLGEQWGKDRALHESQILMDHICERVKEHETH